MNTLRQNEGFLEANLTEYCPCNRRCPPEIMERWQGERRCGLCEYAMRGIDYLPAVSIKTSELVRSVADLSYWIASADAEHILSEDAMEQLAEKHARLSEELTAWMLIQERLLADLAGKR